MIYLVSPDREIDITSAVIRGWSRVDFDQLDYPAPADGSGAVDPMDIEVTRAAGYVKRVTGQVFTAVPDLLLDGVAEAIQMRTEQQVFGRQEDSVSSNAENDILSSFNTSDYCVPLDSEALTPAGWKKHDQVDVGDMVLGLNMATGQAEWTPVLEVIAPFDADVVRLGNSRWGFKCTTNHRWVTRPFKTVNGSRGYLDPLGLVETNKLDARWGHHIVMAARADTASAFNITPAEAGVIAWIVTDGHIKRGKRVPKLPLGKIINGFSACHYCNVKIPRLPGQRGKVQILCDACRPLRTAEREAGYTQATIAQKNHCDALEAVLADAGVPYHKGVFKGRGLWSYGLSAKWVDDLWKRARLDDISLTNFVAGIGSAHRAAFLQAGILAEGTLPKKSVLGPGDRCWDRWQFNQNRGDQLDAFALAAHMEGYTAWPWKTKRDCSGFSLGRDRFDTRHLRVTPVGREQVWCVRTALGTWTMRQNGNIALTGNSENRRSLKELRDAHMVNAWPALNSLLFDCMTDQKRDEWMAYFLDEPVPYVGMAEVTFGLDHDAGWDVNPAGW